MHLLAFELSTEACSVALLVGDELRARHEVAPRRHAELALPWAEALLAEAGIAKSQLDAIAVGRGPGAFTGVRLGISIVQGIALALDRPAVPVSTLAALAMRARALGAEGGDVVFAAIDARMREIYAAAYRFERTAEGALRPIAVDPEVVCPPQDWQPAGEAPGFGVGTGFAAGDGLLQVRLQSRLRTIDAAALPQAADVAVLARIAFAEGFAVAPEHLEPAYLRNQVALTLAEQQALRDARQGG